MSSRNINRYTRDQKRSNSTEVQVLKQKIKCLKKEKSELKREQLLFNALLEHLPEAVYFKDRQSRFIRANKHLVKFFNQKQESDLLGKTDFDFFGVEHASQAFEDEKAIIKSGKPILDIEEKEDHQDGRHTWATTSKIPLYDNDGDIVGTFGISKDITALKQAQAESEAKELFCANMSHEIRTPMNAIMGLTDVLLKTDVDTDQKKYLDVIRISCQNLSSLINDILDLSKLHAQKISLNNSDFDLYKLIEGIVTGFSHMINKKDVSLDYNIDPDMPRFLYGDSLRLNQILLNLVSNAVKFTDHGSVDIRCRLVQTKGVENLIEFIVTDTGIGMKDTSLIFENFEQEYASIAKQFGGTGLGLAICKELTELFGGVIEVHSEYGQGSQFSVTLPFVTSHSKSENDKTSFLSGHKDVLNGKRILLVDDNDINLYVAKTVLNKWEIIVETASNGKECLDTFQTAQFDMILMDLQMPELDGFQTTEHIRKQLKSNVAIMAMTANALQGEKEKCLKVGMDDYISKPFDSNDLLKRLIKHLAQTDVQLSGRTRHRKKLGDTLLYNLDMLDSVVTDNGELQREVIRLFLEQTPDLLGEIKASYDNHNLSELSKKAHKLKSSIDLFGIEQLKPVIRSIERSNEGRDCESLRLDLLLLEDVLSIVTSQLGKKLTELETLG